MPTCPLPKAEVPSSPCTPPPPEISKMDLDPIVDDAMSDDVFDDFEKEVTSTTFKEEVVEEEESEEEKGRQIQMAAASGSSSTSPVGDLGLEDDLLQINRELKMELESFNTSLDKWKSGSCASPGSSHFEFTCTDILGGADGKISW